MRRIILLALPLAALTGCQIDGVKPGSQIGSEDGGCQVQSEDAIADSSAIPDGFTLSPDDVAALSLGAFSGSLERSTGASLAMTLSLTASGDPVREVMDTNDGTEIFCSDLIALPVSVSLFVEGELDESFEAAVRLDQSDAIYVFTQLEDSELQGGAQPDLLVAEELDRLWLYVSGALAVDGSWSGDLEWIGESTEEDDGAGDDASVSATNDVYGSFSVAPEG